MIELQKGQELLIAPNKYTFFFPEITDEVIYFTERLTRSLGFVIKTEHDCSWLAGEEIKYSKMSAFTVSVPGNKPMISTIVDFQTACRSIEGYIFVPYEKNGTLFVSRLPN